MEVVVVVTGGKVFVVVMVMHFGRVVVVLNDVMNLFEFTVLVNVTCP